MLSALIAFGVFMTICEHFDNPTHTLYFGTCFTVVGCIGLFSICSSVGGNNGVIRILDHIGGNYTTVIYVMHMIIGNTLKLILLRVMPGNEDGFLIAWCLPVLICIATTLFAATLQIVKNRIKGARCPISTSK